MKESVVESHLRKAIVKEGGLCEKHVSPGQHGVPDRLITWPWGEMELVETKAPGEKPKPAQVRDHKRRAKLGVRVYVLDTKERVDLFVKARMTIHLASLKEVVT